MSKCKKCGIRECFKVLTRKNTWFTMSSCQSCRFDISRNYVSERVIAGFIESNFTKAPTCTACGKKTCFLKLGKKGYYFSNKCNDCKELFDP